MEFNNITPSHQSAYKANHSCETLLIKLLNDTFWNLEHRKISVLICRDLSAAFDTVDHTVLLFTLENCFGVTSEALNWFKSYLEDRYVKVCVGKEYLNPKSIPYSVPQGSINRPLLFNCCCSTLQLHVLESIGIIGFADDHALLSSFTPSMDVSDNSEQNRFSELENCLIQVGDWMDKIRLKMNPSKTEFIEFGSRAQLKKSTIKNIPVLSDVVKVTDEIRYLSAWLDKHLTFKTHVIKKCKSATANIYKLMHIRRYVDQPTCEIVMYLLYIKSFLNLRPVAMPYRSVEMQYVSIATHRDMTQNKLYQAL